MKRLTAVLLAAALSLGLLALAGCNKQEDLPEASIEVSGTEYVYDGEPKAVRAAVTPADAGTLSIEYTLNGNIVDEPTDAGTYAVTVTLHGSGYRDAQVEKEMVIAPKELTVEGIVAEDKIYDGIGNVSFLNTGNLVGVVAGDVVNIVRIMAAAEDKNAGTDKQVQVSRFILGGKDKDNYTVRIPDDVTMDIVAKELKIGGVTIDVKEEGSGVAATYTGDPILVGVEGDDDVSIEIDRFEFPDEQSGRDKKMKVYATLQGADSGNYYIDEQNCGVTGIIGIIDGDFLLAANREGDEILSYSVLSYMGSSRTVSIPAEFNGKSVTAIADYAFSGSTAIDSVSVPDSVERIGMEAFSYSSVKNVTFGSGSSLKEIGYMAFTGSGIERFEVPAAVEVIEGDAFKESELASLSFAERAGVQPLRLVLEERVFFDTMLQSVTVPGYVSAIGYGCFQECDVLKDAVFEKSLYDIEFGNAPDGRAWTFAWSTVESITFNGGISEVPKTFAQETPLNTVNLSEGIETIGFCAFIFTKVQSVVIPASVTRIEEGAFKSVDTLSNVQFAAGGTDPLVIEEFVFYQTRIASIDIPANVSYLGWGTIAQIPTLQTVTFRQGDGSIPLLIANDAFDQNPLLTTVTLPDRVQAYADNVFDDICTVINGEGKAKDKDDPVFNVPRG